MKITVDTNILVRAVVRDNKKQAQTAADLLLKADLIAVPLPCLCEFVWVLHRVYGFGQPDISAALDALLNAVNVAVNRPAVDAGLAVLNAGGDFADGIIAYEGKWLGGETFVSFDKRAVSLLGKAEATDQAIDVAELPPFGVENLVNTPSTPNLPQPKQNNQKISCADLAV